VLFQWPSVTQHYLCFLIGAPSVVRKLTRLKLHVLSCSFDCKYGIKFGGELTSLLFMTAA
jgi:cAMP phosphodiesterase